MRTFRCPDCGRDAHHAPGCPFAADLRAAADTDRHWFAGHPDDVYRWREATWAEAHLVGWAIVTRHGDVQDYLLRYEFCHEHTNGQVFVTQCDGYILRVLADVEVLVVSDSGGFQDRPGVFEIAITDSDDGPEVAVPW